MDNPSDVQNPVAPGATTLPDTIGRQNSAPLFQQIEPISTAQGDDGKPVTVEIATVRRNIFIPPTYNWVLRPRDPTLRTRGGGWDYEIYEQAEMDPKVYSALQKRKGALGAYPVQIDAASDKPLDIAAAELVRRAKDSFNFPLMVKNLLDAINKGFGVVELMWELVDGPSGPEWHTVEALPRDQRRFRFDEFRRLRLVDWENLITGELLPDRKFIVYTFNAKDGDPYGRGLGSMLWWNAFFKRENQQAWLIANDKFAVPTLHGTYPAEASDEEKNAVYAALLSFSTDAAIASADGTEIKVIETARAAGSDTFKVMRDAQNEDIDEIVLGSSYATHAGPLDGGSGATADQDDRLELAQADGNDLAMVLSRSWVKWIVEVNMPGARPPTLRWLVDAEEDLSQRAERDSKIESMGFEPSEDYINETYGGVWTKAATIAPVITDAITDSTSFAQKLRTFLGERRDRPAFAQTRTVAPTNRIAGVLTDQLAEFADPVVSNWVGEFRNVVETSATLEEAQDRLIDLYSQMDGTHFAQTMAAAIQVADLAGRLDAKHGG